MNRSTGQNKIDDAKTTDSRKLSIAFSNRSLCTRSGTCIGACPENALSVDEDFYPKLDPGKCTDCGLCARICPGGTVNFKDLTETTFGHRNDDVGFDGHVEMTYIGYASDEGIRGGGAGGGVVTALLWDLLKHGTVDGCIVTRMNPDTPWHGEVFIARTYEELLMSQQSKYIVIPVNSILAEIRDLPGKYALAALPCQIHGIRMLQRQNDPVVDKIGVIVGLFCASAMEPNVALEMMEMRGVDPSEVVDFAFRDGDWPGQIRATTRDGLKIPLHESNFKDGAINYMTYLYSPFRCQTCIDGSAEFSDISVSDAWTRDEFGNYLFSSQSKLLARTDLGVRTMKNAIQTGTLVAKDVTEEAAYKTHKLHTVKKGMNGPLRVARLHRAGRSAPNYDRLVARPTLREQMAELSESFVMWLGRRRWTRYPLFRFLTSKYGWLFIAIRQRIKRRKYRGNPGGAQSKKC
ncbi:MAG: 4Fe-4S dicluster domain-containing protein [Gammaproteobacteria bacterium]|nr:4Fe-4S dicluster domain-containing protein [Gammaproteobacteria bacterium]